MAIERRLNMEQMLQRFEWLGANLSRAVFIAMAITGKVMLARVVRKLRGEYLNVRTGHGWQSMQDFAKANGDTMKAGIDSDVIYMKAHEEGFHGIVNVREHTAQHRGRAKLVDIRTRQVVKRFSLTRRERDRGPWMVRAHSMRMNLRARHSIKDTVDEEFEPTQQRVTNAVLFAANNGKLPTPAQVVSG